MVKPYNSLVVVVGPILEPLIEAHISPFKNFRWTWPYKRPLSVTDRLGELAEIRIEGCLNS